VSEKANTYRTGDVRISRGDEGKGSSIVGNVAMLVSMDETWRVGARVVLLVFELGSSREELLGQQPVYNDT
jgi:hypothetical protein